MPVVFTTASLKLSLELANNKYSKVTRTLASVLGSLYFLFHKLPLLCPSPWAQKLSTHILMMIKSHSIVLGLPTHIFIVYYISTLDILRSILM